MPPISGNVGIVPIEPFDRKENLPLVDPVLERELGKEIFRRQRRIFLYPAKAFEGKAEPGIEKNRGKILFVFESILV